MKVFYVYLKTEDGIRDLCKCKFSLLKNKVTNTFSYSYMFTKGIHKHIPNNQSTMLFLTHWPVYNNNDIQNQGPL